MKRNSWESWRKQVSIKLHFHNRKCFVCICFINSSRRNLHILWHEFTRIVHRLKLMCTQYWWLSPLTMIRYWASSAIVRGMRIPLLRDVVTYRKPITVPVGVRYSQSKPRLTPPVDIISSENLNSHCKSYLGSIC